MYKARLRAATVYQKRQGNYCDVNMAKEIHLTAQQYKENEVDWLSHHSDAWAWMCKYWASEEFLSISNRNRMNRLSKPGVHFFGADGHVGKAACNAPNFAVEFFLFFTDVFYALNCKRKIKQIIRNTQTFQRFLYI